MKTFLKVFVGIFSIVIFFLGAPLAGNASVSLPAKISEVFPDDNLANAIANNLNVSVDTIVTQQILADISTFSMQSHEVSNLEGLEYLTGANSIDLYGGKNITDLSPLSGLNNLTNLDIAFNNVTDLSPIANLNNLYSFSATGNSINDISPLANMTTLRYLSLNSQTITNPELNYTSLISIPNNIINLNGTIIAPSTISDNGVYEEPNVEWDLPAYLPTVSYKFSKSVSVANAQATFSGTVNQPLKEVLDYTVDFDVDGVVSDTESIAEGNLITAPVEPTKTGYTFQGWYDAAEGGNKWDFSSDKMPARDITLYAQFSLNSYDVNFDVDGTTTSETVDYNALIQEPQNPIKPGYTFTGWYDAKEGGNKWNFETDKMPANDVTLYARFGLISDTSNNNQGGAAPKGPKQKHTLTIKTESSTKTKEVARKTLPVTGDANSLPLLITGMVLLSSVLFIYRKRV
ncbi:LPXTG cell wall anchor domain-containing protein [Listeria seeligeri]|uniref:InlB B-repeat-containing protein n=1 Tax=Listeria seeligeri TaxID=1640 RepID=UPI0016247231|nr:InlB B-repeat-containing protein [Listeria seeligeri]MBC1528685.1 LPXTG cell wall anchor domain-containing protein [Listeria seeligeri]MBC1764426.1 LPXTG cell wall anchor domain-containing protein [Listeria seeligeri]MBC1882257.1 LPXTG cell wall anchor domain-containing protein [Listeria seeligeri]